jgi:hypothetical protein
MNYSTDVQLLSEHNLEVKLTKAVSKVTDYEFDIRRSILETGRDSLRHDVRIGSWAHPASYPMNVEGYLPGVKRPESEAIHSPLYSFEVKKA